MKISLSFSRRQIKSYFWTGFFIVCFLLNSGYAYNLVDNGFTLISLFLCCFVVILKFGVLRKCFINKLFWQNPYLILSICILLCMIIHSDLRAWGSYAHQIAILLIAALFSLNISFEHFSKVFVKFMVLVTIISICAWIIINLLGIKLPLPIMISNSDIAYKDYYNGILFFIYRHSPKRLMGPFWEPGVYASMTTIALLLQNKAMDNISRRKQRITTFILAIGIILSMSTAGYILLVMTLIIRFLQGQKKTISAIATLGLLVLFLCLIVFQDQITSWLAMVAPDIFEKLTFDSFSKMTRINGPLVDLSIFVQFPIIGAGMSKYLILWPIYALKLSVESRTSTITYFLANYGVTGILYLYILLKATIGQKNIRWVIRLLLLILFISIVSKEPHYFNLLTITVFAYLIQEPLFSNELREKK